MRIPFDVGEAMEPRTLSFVVRLLFGLALAGACAWVIVSAHDLRAAWRELRRPHGSEPAARVVPWVAATEAEAPAADFVQDLPAAAPTDAQIRFAAKLARESQVDLQRMQSEPLHVDPRHLGQVRVTLQLRGDYRDEKALLGALLAKFPGLVLERLEIRHRGEAPGAKPGDVRSDDEATLELTQYIRPAGA